MPGRPIETGEAVFAELLRASSADPDSPRPQDVLAATRAFARIDFETPDEFEADGFLFEYGIFSHSGPAAFTLALTRQLEKVDEHGDHESYTQIRCELEYDATEELVSLGKRNSWWFRGSSKAFDSWLAEIAADPVWTTIRELEVSRFEVYEDVV